MMASTLLARAVRVRGKRLYCLAFLSAAVVTAGLTSSSLSQARVVPAATCGKIDTTFAWPKLTATGLYNLDTGFASVVCGYPDISGDSKSSVSTIYVDVYDGDPYGGIGAQACSQPYWGGSMHCGSSVSEDDSGFTGNTSVVITGTDVTNAWGSSFAYDYGTLTVTPANDSTIYGFTTF